MAKKKSERGRGAPKGGWPHQQRRADGKWGTADSALRIASGHGTQADQDVLASRDEPEPRPRRTDASAATSDQHAPRYAPNADDLLRDAIGAARHSRRYSDL